MKDQNVLGLSNASVVEHTKRSFRATQKPLFKAAFAGDIGYIVKNANAEERLLSDSLRANRHAASSKVARSHGIPDTVSNERLADDSMAIR